MHAFDRKRDHNMLALMFDLKFNNMWSVIAFLGVKMLLLLLLNMIKSSCCLY